AGIPAGSVDIEGDHPDFRISPDEKLLAASLLDPKTGTTDIWMTDLTRGSHTRMTRGGQISAAPIWSPDGTKVLFRTNRGGTIEFFEMPPGGSGEPRTVLTHARARTAQIQS